MAKRKAAQPRKLAKSGRRVAATRSVKRPTRKASAAKNKKRAVARKAPKAKIAKSRAKPARRGTVRARVRRAKTPRLDRVRRTLEEAVQTPPSSLNMDRHGSAARTGRAELAGSRRELGGMSPAITGGDVDADLENAYFSGDEAPGGDNPTPDQDIVDDIGKALGVQYQDNEELRAAAKVEERDKHRWELDPASSEDYKERD